MSFKVHDNVMEESSGWEKSGYEISGNENRIPFKNIDLSYIKKDSIVGLIDGDWLAYSVCCTLSEFDGIHVAKGRINSKIDAFIEASKCTEIIVFCGSTGNYRSDLLLPKRINTTSGNSGRYKDNRRDQESPPYLEEIKHWLQAKFTSWWAVGMEADDCIVMSSVYLTKYGIVSYIFGIDKDYNQIHGGGLAIVGHQDRPTFFEDNEKNQLGELFIKERTVVREDGSTYKVKDVKGHGDKFLVYQCLSEDAADNYSCKNFIKNNFNGGNFGDVAAVKLINKANTRTELWWLYISYLREKLPFEFEYEAWNGEIVKSNPMHIANLYFQCACMIREEGVLPHLFNYMEYRE